MKKLLTFGLILSLLFGGLNPALAKEKAKKKSSIVKKAVIAYVAYKVITSGKDKKEESKPKSYYAEEPYPSYDEEECEDEEECDEE